MPFQRYDPGGCDCDCDGGPPDYACGPCRLPAIDLTVAVELIDAGTSGSYTLTYRPGPSWITGCITDGVVGDVDNPAKIALTCTGPAGIALTVYRYAPGVPLFLPCPPGDGLVPPAIIEDSDLVSWTCDPLDLVFTINGTDSDTFTITP